MLFLKIKKFIKEVLDEAFPIYPYHVISKQQDSLTRKATFAIKAKKVAMPIELSTEDFFQKDEYLLGLPQKDRNLIVAQYLTELAQPQAYIESLPFKMNEKNQLIFKILLLEEKKMLVGCATYFMTTAKNILPKLGHNDLIKLTTAYCEENALNNPSDQPLTRVSRKVVVLHE